MLAHDFRGVAVFSAPTCLRLGVVKVPFNGRSSAGELTRRAPRFLPLRRWLAARKRAHISHPQSCPQRTLLRVLPLLRARGLEKLRRRANRVYSSYRGGSLGHS